MKKRIASLLLAVLLLVSMTACARESAAQLPAAQETQETQETQTEVLAQSPADAANSGTSSGATR